jgi:TetR/AcrR family transcriptional repressor of nem operon
MVEIILKWIKELLEKGKAKKIFAFNDDPENRALAIFSSLVASLQLSKIMNKVDYKSFHQTILENLKP